MAATCKTCLQEMLPGAGCTLKQFNDMNGGPYNRVLYESDDGDCHDCNVRDGQLHHPGCDVERCPKCNGQAISSDCTESLN